jgi:hypothetical protein
MCVYVCVYVYVQYTLNAKSWLELRVCLYMYVCMCVHAFVCLSISKEKEKECRSCKHCRVFIKNMIRYVYAFVSGFQAFRQSDQKYAQITCGIRYSRDTSDLTQYLHVLANVLKHTTVHSTEQFDTTHNTHNTHAKYRRRLAKLAG